MFAKKLLFIGAANLLSLPAFADVYKCSIAPTNKILSTPSSPSDAPPLAKFTLDTDLQDSEQVIVGEGFGAGCIVFRGPTEFLICYFGNEKEGASAVADLGTSLLGVVGYVSGSLYGMTCTKNLNP